MKIISMRLVLLGITIAILAGCAPDLVVYSPHGPDVLKDYERLFEAAHPELDVQMLDMGSQDVYTRVRAERNRPVCDVWWGGPSTMLMQAADEGLLEPYRPSWADQVAADAKDAQDRWYGTYLSPLAILFNTQGYSRDQVPQTWDALLEPKWQDKITLRKPLDSGTMRTFIGAMIARAPDEEAGLEWLRTLHESTEAYLENPQLLYDHVKRNPELISVWLMPDVVLQRERNGYPFDFVVPPQSPMITEGIAIVKDAPHAETARLFYEFVTTQDALVHQAKSYAKMPTRHDVDRALLPEWMGKQTIDPMTIDWAAFAEKTPRWCERWEKEVYEAR